MLSAENLTLTISMRHQSKDVTGIHIITLIIHTNMVFIILMLIFQMNTRVHGLCDIDTIRHIVPTERFDPYYGNRKEFREVPYNATINCSELDQDLDELVWEMGFSENYPCFLIIKNSILPKIKPSFLIYFKGISTLHMVDLQIRTLLPGSFNGLNKLEELYLQENNIGEISQGQFNSLHNLKVLNLSHNNIEIISTHSFLGLKKLEELYLDFNKIEKIDTLFESQQNLKILHLSWNVITEIYNTFENLTKLSKLYLSHNNISEVSFANLPTETLNELDLSDNEINNITNWSDFNGSIFLVNNNNLQDIERVKSDVLDSSHNNLVLVQSGYNLFDAELKELNLGYNFIRFDMEQSEPLFLNLSKLTYLNLEHNEIEVLPNVCFRDLISLTILDLSGNSITRFEYGVFDRLSNLNYLDVSYNRLDSLYESTLYSLNDLEDLRFHNNQIVNININQLIMHLKHIKQVSLGNNAFICKNLVYIVHRFKNLNISVENGHHFYGSNVNGIACSNKTDKIDVNVEDTTDNKNSDGELRNVLNEEFSNSLMYKYFNNDFKHSNFFKYLESMKNSKLVFEKYMTNESASMERLVSKIELGGNSSDNTSEFNILVVLVIIIICMFSLMLYAVFFRNRTQIVPNENVELI